MPEGANIGIAEKIFSSLGGRLRRLGKASRSVTSRQFRRKLAADERNYIGVGAGTRASMNEERLERMARERQDD
jgi:hypothetical protein